MSLPAAWTKVTVTGTFYNLDGTPASGAIRFFSSQVVVIDGIVVVPTELVAPLDSTGSFSIQLPSTDDPSMNVTGWAYRVVEDYERGRSYNIFVEYNGGAIDLATVAPVVDPPDLVTTRGPRGYSAYEVAVQGGFQGTMSEWLATLGGIPGASAYDVAVENGFVGTEEEWLASLSGDVTPEALAAQAAAEAAQAAAEAARGAAETAQSAAETAATTATTSATNATFSATAAANSATAAATSATASANSATAADSSAAASASSATDSGNSASAAATSETNAANSATAAGTSESNAAGSASAAATSAAGAANSASNAATASSNAADSATAAASSATASSGSATTALNSAAAANDSATAAASSATAAASSATSASNSADAAAALIAGTALLRHGTGAPGSGLGNNGDYYLDDTAPKTLYGPKAAGAWPAGVSLKGDTGDPGRVPNIQSVTSSATVTPTFSNDLVKITAQAAALTLANPTGTAIPGLGMVIRVKDNGTARAISYGTQYRAIGVTLPTTTVIGKTTYMGMIYNSDDTKWDVIAVGTQA